MESLVLTEEGAERVERMERKSRSDLRKKGAKEGWERGAYHCSVGFLDSLAEMEKKVYEKVERDKVQAVISDRRLMKVQEEVFRTERVRSAKRVDFFKADRGGASASLFLSCLEGKQGGAVVCCWMEGPHDPLQIIESLLFPGSPRPPSSPLSSSPPPSGGRRRGGAGKKKKKKETLTPYSCLPHILPSLGLPRMATFFFSSPSASNSFYDSILSTCSFHSPPDSVYPFFLRMGVCFNVPLCTKWMLTLLNRHIDIHSHDKADFCDHPVIVCLERYVNGMY